MGFEFNFGFGGGGSGGGGGDSGFSFGTGGGMGASREARKAAKVLGVPAGASRAEVLAAHRTLSRQWHPDKYHGDPAEALDMQVRGRRCPSSSLTVRCAFASFVLVFVGPCCESLPVSALRPARADEAEPGEGGDAQPPRRPRELADSDSEEGGRDILTVLIGEWGSCVLLSWKGAVAVVSSQQQ